MATIVPGAYQLLIRLRLGRTLTVGALGRIDFQPGWYVYSGSARNGLAQRIQRHLRREKRMHWHVDHLLAVADGVEAFVSPGLDRSECELHAGLPRGGTPIIGFGSSDCRCVSHLAYFRTRPVIKLMRWVRGTCTPPGGALKFTASGSAWPY